MKIVRGWIAIVSLLALPMGFALLASAETGSTTTEPATTRLEGEQVAVGLELWTTKPNGAKKRTGTASESIRVGQRAQAYVSTTAGGCGTSLGSGVGSPELRRNSDYFWSVDALVVDATMEEIVMDVEWQRLEAGAVGGGGRRSISLREGESHVLDFYRGDEAGDGSRCALNAVIELTAAVIEDPELRDAKIHYDLWLSDESPTGERQTRHVERVGGQGEEVQVDFDSLRWRIEERGARADVIADVVSGMRGRLRRDGTLNLHFSATRWLGIARTGDARTGGIGDGGTTIVNVSLNEPVQLVLPVPKGASIQTWGRSSTVHSDFEPSDSTEGITVDPDGARVEFEPFFREHSMSLILTATME